MTQEDFKTQSDTNFSNTRSHKEQVSFFQGILDQNLGTYMNNEFVIDTNKIIEVIILLRNASEQGANINSIITDFLEYAHNTSIYNINHIKILNVLKVQLLQLPNNPLSADNLLKLAVSSVHERTSKEEISLRYNLVKEVIALGANVNVDYELPLGKTRPLDKVGDNGDLIKLLKSNGAKCSNESERARDFFQDKILPNFFHPKKIANQIKENLAIEVISNDNKIPYIMHHIWLTHPSDPREIKQDQMKVVLETNELLQKNENTWNHIVWTNDKSLIPESIAILEAHGFEVRSIEDYREQLRLFEKIEELVDQKLYGMASDILRYCLIEQFGGVYSDLNFEFKRNFESEMHKYNFFSKDFQNSFFAASPSHPIMWNLLNIVEENLFNPPEYIKSIDAQDIITQTVYTTLLPFGAAYIESANSDYNIDTVLELNECIELESLLGSKGEEACPDYYNIFYNTPSSEQGFCFRVQPFFNNDNSIGIDQTGLSWLEA